MAARKKRRRKTKRKSASKSLTQRVSVLEKAIMPKGNRQPRVRIISTSSRQDMTPPHLRRQLGL